MQRSHAKPSVLGLVLLGVAVWFLIAVTVGTARRGYYVPAAIETGVLIAAAAMFCSNAARQRR